MAVVDTERLRAALERLGQLERPDSTLDERMRDFIMSAEDTTLQALNPYELARRWGINRRDLLSWFVYATHIGLFDLSWNMRCPRCGNVSLQLVNLKDAAHAEFCPTCHADYEVGFDEQVEVTFTINPTIRQLDPGSMSSTRLPHSWLEEHVHGLDLALLPEFTQLFKDQTLSSRESLAVRTLTILFTDIAGSTQLYERLGDARAYNLVRAHFDVLFEAVQVSQGQIVKTIGDSVMAVFALPDCAVRAALIAQRDIAQFNARQGTEEGRILIKIGIHSGPAIVVTLNDHLDYFGTMINQAARIQKQSRSEETMLSEVVYTDPCVQGLLRQEPNVNVTGNAFELRGFSEIQTLYSVTFGSHVP